MVGVYRITSPTGKTYIGQSVEIERRWERYGKLLCKNQPRLYNSLQKYGVSQHIFEVVEECSVEELNTKERYWQDFYNVLTEGLNCKLTETVDKSGHLSQDTKKRIGKANKISQLGKVISKDTKLKMSKAKREMTEVTKEKMSKARIGKPSPIKGTVLSEEHKKKIGDAHRGKILTDEIKNKISASKKGKAFGGPKKGCKLSEEHKKKLSDSRKGKASGGRQKGYTHTEETKQKIRETLKKRLSK